jgi:hypothetical protein
MKQQWWYRFVFMVMLSISGLGQTLLNSFDIPLQRPNNMQSVLVGVNEKNEEITAFVSDKYRVTAVKYNPAVFFKDSLSALSPDKKVGVMLGSGFAMNEHPVLFYVSEDFKRVQSVLFDFNRRATIKKTYELPVEGENVISYFSDKNTFSVLTVVKGKDLLRWYNFKDNTLEVMLLNLEEVAKDFKEKPSQLLHVFFEMHPLEKMDTRIFNPLFFACSKSKLYFTPQGLTLTFDQRKDATKLIVVNKEEGTLEHFHHATPKLDFQNHDSNSFLMDDLLFHLTAHKKELLFSVKNISTNEELKSYRLKEKQPLEIANTEMLSIIDGQRPRTFKNMAPFLSALSGTDLGVSVHKIRDQYHVQLGGRKWVMSSGDYVFGVLAAVAGSGDLGVDWNSAKMVFFETLLDEEFNYVKSEERRMAQDYLSFFVADEKISLMSPVVFYKESLIMAYYDRKEQKLILRKFEDDLY